MVLNLRQIEIFRAVMTTGSISGASQLLFVSQPAVSRLLSHTEQRVGFPAVRAHQGPPLLDARSEEAVSRSRGRLRSRAAGARTRARPVHAPSWHPQHRQQPEHRADGHPSGDRAVPHPLSRRQGHTALPQLRLPEGSATQPPSRLGRHHPADVSSEPGSCTVVQQSARLRLSAGPRAGATFDVDLGRSEAASVDRLRP